MVIICKMCNKEFSTYKEDKRILFCSSKCRTSYRSKNKYMTQYYENNKLKWKERQKLEDFKAEKNKKRREKYSSDVEYRKKMQNCAKNQRIKNPLTRFKNELIKKYGITIDIYSQMLENQNNKCAICKSESSNTKLTNRFYVDHDHKTGKVRGLLCNNCNFALGHFSDNITILENAIKYLKGSKK